MTISTHATLLEILHSDLSMDPARVQIDSTLIGDLGFRLGSLRDQRRCD